MAVGFALAALLSIEFGVSSQARPADRPATATAANPLGAAAGSDLLGTHPLGAAAALAPSASATSAPQATASPASATAPPPPLQAIRHIVGEGETLSEIAELYGVSADAIVWANDGVDDPDFLSVGQELIVPPVTGILHEVLAGDTLLDIAATYGADVEGIAEANRLAEPFFIYVGQMLVVPGGRPPEPPAALVAEARLDPPSRGGSAEEAAEPEPAATATVVAHPELSAKGEAFIASILEPALRSQREFGVPASVTIAQAIWETNWGQSGLAIKANNYFGIKGRPKPGPAGVIWMETWEHVNGRDITVTEPFRAYHSVEESVMDHGRYLTENSRYAEAMRNTSDPRLFIRLVHRAGYATDPAYSDKIIRLMDRYNLYVYDE